MSSEEREWRRERGLAPKQTYIPSLGKFLMPMTSLKNWMSKVYSAVGRKIVMTYIEKKENSSEKDLANFLYGKYSIEETDNEMKITIEKPKQE